MLHERISSPAFKAIQLARRRALHTPPRILVAEDDPELRELVTYTLRKDGYSLLEVTDGGRLLVNLGVQFQNGDQDLDLIISDIRMPVCTGLDILEALRRAHWTIPVILMTAFGDDETRRRTEALGGLLFNKPFALDDLRTAVMNLVPIA